MYNTKKNEGSHVNISMNSCLISQAGLIWGGYFVVMAIFCCVCVGRGARKGAWLPHTVCAVFDM